MLTPLCGLATRPLRTLIGGDVTENLGDALWAMLVYWLIVMLRPQLAIGRAASVAMIISAARSSVNSAMRPGWIRYGATRSADSSPGGAFRGRSARLCVRNHRLLRHGSAANQKQDHPMTRHLRAEFARESAQFLLAP